MVSAASHELKTPLVLIRGLAEALADNAYDTPEKQKEMLGRIEFSSAAALALIDDILTVAKLESDNPSQLHLEAVNPQSLLYEVAQQLDPIAKSYEQTIVVKRYRGPAMFVNRRSVERIVYNLLTNAIKYSPSGSKTVLSSKYVASDQIRINVNDTGIGVKEKDIKKIFAKFGTSKQPISKYSGSTGLGLHIVKNLTEAMDGQFGLVQKQRGSNFFVSFPVASQLSLFEQQ